MIVIIHKFFGNEIGKMLYCINDKYDELQEIRLRVGQGLSVIINSKEYYINESGVSDIPYVVSKTDINNTLQKMSNYSFYAIEEQLKNGFFTISGGHRIGVTGEVVVENNSIKTIKNINSMNVRVSHQIKGCADKIYKNIFNNGVVKNLLIVSPPNSGKTTLLRDVVRLISDNGINTVVVDERSEIASAYEGIPQNDVGKRTDVYDNCPKHIGMQLALRSMSPKVIVVDEIGSKEDIESIEDIMSCGVKVFATIHARSIDELTKKNIGKLLSEFELIVLLDNKKIVGLYDGEFNKIGVVV